MKDLDIKNEIKSVIADLLAERTDHQLMGTTPTPGNTCTRGTALSLGRLREVAAMLEEDRRRESTPVFEVHENVLSKKAFLVDLTLARNRRTMGLFVEHSAMAEWKTILEDLGFEVARP